MYVFHTGKVLFILALLVGVIMPNLVWVERRIAAFCQNRVGPNRVGPFGLLQTLADAIKLIFKEDFIPAEADKWLYRLAPVIAMVPGALAFAIIPFGSQVEVGGQVMPLVIADLDVGILFAMAAMGLSVYGISFGGWASNNKYSMLGGVRSSAQLVSYEVALSLAIVAILMTTGSVRMGDIVLGQTGTWFGWLPQWNVFQQPVAFLVFLFCAFAENQRLPFDVPEAEPELIGGYHTEYAGIKFGIFFQGEYLAMLTMSGLLVTLFLGGWHVPGVPVDSTSWGWAAATTGIFFAKVGLVVLFYIFIRWTLPRFRYTDVMRIGWKFLIPLALANVAATAALGVLA